MVFPGLIGGMIHYLTIANWNFNCAKILKSFVIELTCSNADFRVQCGVFLFFFLITLVHALFIQH